MGVALGLEVGGEQKQATPHVDVVVGVYVPALVEQLIEHVVEGWADLVELVDEHDVRLPAEQVAREARLGVLGAEEVLIRLLRLHHGELDPHELSAKRLAKTAGRLGLADAGGSVQQDDGRPPVTHDGQSVQGRHEDPLALLLSENLLANAIIDGIEGALLDLLVSIGDLLDAVLALGRDEGFQGPPRWVLDEERPNLVCLLEYGGEVRDDVAQDGAEVIGVDDAVVHVVWDTDPRFMGGQVTRPDLGVVAPDGVEISDRAVSLPDARAYQLVEARSWPKVDDCPICHVPLPPRA